MKYPEFTIDAPDRSITTELQQAIDRKTKPVGSLGRLEQIALKMGLIQQSVAPVLKNPHILVFAGDHGIADEGVSAYPKEVTRQMVLNFLSGGAAINVFTRQHDIGLTIVDAGVYHDFSHDFGAMDHPGFRSEKIGMGTKNFLQQPAMSREECIRAVETGGRLTEELFQSGTNIIGFGEMGIGNTSAASLLTAALTGASMADCVGRGTGLDDAGLKRKTDILERALKKMNGFTTERANPTEVLQYAGGFEMAMMCGAMLKAAELKMAFLVDGFIATSVFLCACRWYPSVVNYAFFCHLSGEKGHKRLLEEFDEQPLLDLEMRLGEGSGCAVAYPLIESAVLFLNEMASFDEAGVDDGNFDDAGTEKTGVNAAGTEKTAL